MKFGISKTALPFAVLTLFLGLPSKAHASPIYKEVLSGNGETRSVTTRIITAPSSGRYFLTLKNGTRGPRLVEQCETEDTIEEKCECRFENLNEKIDRDFTRVQDALIYINGSRVRNPLAPSEKTITKSRGLLIIPVQLVNGANEIRTDLLGYSTARLEYSIELASVAKAAPAAFFLLNRNVGTTAQAFNLSARESFSPEGNPISYTWSWGDEALSATAQAPASASAVTATHTYRTPGVFNAKLVVKDTVTSLSSTFTTEVVVKAVPRTPSNEKPKPVIQWAIDGSNPMRVLFDGTQSTDDGSISTYNWKITSQAGASQTVTGSSFGYTFSASGSYNIRLTIKDDLNLSAVQDRVISVAPVSNLVADETLFGPKIYFGTLSAEAVATEPLILSAPQLARLKIKNGDGASRSIEDCSSVAWPGKIECLFRNVVNRAYISLYRLNKVTVSINGRKVTDGSSITKQTASFETVVALAEVNTIEIRTRGWPTAFASVELQSLEQNIAPVADVTFTPPGLGVPKLVEFNAATSTDANDQVMSYRFQAKLAGAPSYSLDTDWQADPLGRLTFQIAGNYDVLVSVRDKFGAVGTKLVSVSIRANNAPVIASAFYQVLTDTVPYQVRAVVVATDSDPGDVLMYNFSFSNGQQTGFQTVSRGVTTFGSLGIHFVDISVRDSSGETTAQRLSINLDGNKIPVSNLSFATPRSGYAPHTISFNGSASYDPDGAANELRYFWLFGDGTPEFEGGPTLTHTYPNGGEYTMTMSVVDRKGGFSQQTRSVFAWTTAPPVPRYAFTRTLNSLQINFDASTSSPGDSPIQRYTWEFGDGVFARNLTAPTTSHTYPAAGFYTAFLRVYDREGDADIVSQTFGVFNGQKPIADVQLTSIDAIVPATFGLSAANSVSPNFGAAITDYKWTLPNGETRSTQNITYASASAGNSEIKLEVRDTFGFWSDIAIRTVTSVQGELPIARISVDKNDIYRGETIRLSGVDSVTPNALANILTYEWTTPSGTKFYGPSVDVVLTEAGLNNVTLKVTDSKGYASTLSSVQVNVRPLERPLARINLADNGSGIYPLILQANAVGSTTSNLNSVINGYEWRVSAPGQADLFYFGESVRITLPLPATWTVSLRIFDSAGAVSDWASVVYSSGVNRIPVAVISPLGLLDTAPAEVIFNGLLSYDSDGQAIVAWHWLFSDGVEAFGPMPSRRYENPGTYTATLRVQDSLWAWSDPVTVTISVLQNTAPVGLFTIQNDLTNRHRKTFDASASFDMDGTIASYSWFVTDAEEGGPAVGIGTGRELTYTFPRTGSYTVILDVFDNKGAKSQATSLSVTITDSPTLLKAFYEVDEVNPMRFSFKASGTTDADGIASFRWAEGTETLSMTSDFDFTFATEGVHTVTLEVRDVLGSLTTRTLEVFATSGPNAAIKIVSPGFEAKDFFESTRIDEAGSLEISSIPSQLILKPQILTLDDGLRFEWMIKGAFQGSSASLPLTILEVSSKEIELLVRNADDSIIARAKRTINSLAATCGEDDSASPCLNVSDSVSGFQIQTSDLSVTVPMSETILQLGTVSLNSADGLTSVDFSDFVAINQNILTIPRDRILASEIANGSNGPYVLKVDVVGTEEGFNGQSVPFNISASKLNLPADPMRLIIKDSVSGFTIYDQHISGGDSISVPAADLDISASKVLTSGDTLFSMGRISTRFGVEENLRVEFRSSEIEIGSIVSEPVFVAQRSALNTQVEDSMAAASIGSGDLTNSGVVAGVVLRRPASLPFGYSYSPSTPVGFGRRYQYFLEDTADVWATVGLTSPLGSSKTEERFLECKAFEANWLIDDDIQSALAGHPTYSGAKAEGAAIQKKRQDLNDAYNSAFQKLVNDVGYGVDFIFIAENWGKPGIALGNFTVPEQQAISCCLSQIYATNSAFFALQDYILASNPRLAALGSAVMEFENRHGGSTPTWLHYTFADSRRFNVQIVTKQGARQQIELASFSSLNLKGSFEAPPDNSLPGLVEVPIAPVNPFSVASTKSVRIPIRIPAGTTSVRFSISPAEGKIESKELKPFPDGLEFTGTSEFSAACRLSNDAYNVKSVYIDPFYANPAALGAEVTILEQLSTGNTTIISALEKLVNITFIERSKQIAMYAAFNLFNDAQSSVPVNLDLDAANKPNPLWVLFGANRPEASDFNHLVEVEVSHPANQRPARLEMVITPQTGAPFIKTGSILKNRGPSKTLYRVEVPMDVVVEKASLASTDPLVTSPGLKIEFRPVRSDGLTSNVYPKEYFPEVLFNARFKNFKTSAAGVRDIYSVNASPFVGKSMLGLMNAFDIIGVTSGSGTIANDFYINDGTLPFGGSFAPTHAFHADGARLDVRTFGVRDSQYEATGSAGRSTLFLPNTRFDDIAVLIGANRLAAVAVQASGHQLIWKQNCGYSGQLNADACDTKMTVEQCLLFVDNPGAETACAEVQAAVNFAPGKLARVRLANERLANWVKRNQEALFALRVRLPALKLPNFSLYHSSGKSIVTKAAIVSRINAWLPPNERITYTQNRDLVKIVSDEWNLIPLFQGETPGLKTESSNGYPSMSLMTSSFDKVSSDQNARGLFLLEESTGHFNHYHTNAK